MAARKTERLVNLTILLLSSRRFVPREKIREAVEGYRGLPDENFERMFERDKEELRALGVPIEVGADDPAFDDEVGYRIFRTDFELPAIEFTSIEATILGLAATVWQQASIADQTAQALSKLRAGGTVPDTGRLGALAPRLSAREDAFEPLWQAVIDRQAVQFEYQSRQRRTVEPWRLAWRNNIWYVLGYDRDRRQPRMFKLSRITSLVQPLGVPDAFEHPAEDEISALQASLQPQPDQQVVLAIRGERAPALRRRGEPCESPIKLPEGFSSYQVPFSSDGAVAEIASYGADVLVCEPAELRAEVLKHLRGVLRVHGEDQS